MTLAKILVFTMPLCLAGCLYQVEVEQGNLLSPEEINRLRPRMNQAECRYLLGTPLLDRPFWSNRWDYLYELRRGEITERQHLALFFDREGQLVALQGDFRPRPEAIKPKPKVESTEVQKRQISRGLFEIIEEGLRHLWPF